MEDTLKYKDFGPIKQNSLSRRTKILEEKNQDPGNDLRPGGPESWTTRTMLFNTNKCC